jgi:uncharacterized protein involved in exopolysaccharide biosynthesis
MPGKILNACKNMRTKRISFILIVIFLFSVNCLAQQSKKTANTVPVSNSSGQSVKATPAYAELILRKTELESVLEDLSTAYTEEYPKFKETRYQLSLIEKDLAKLLSFGSTDLTRMTLALGKLLVRRAELDTDLWSLKTRFSDTHPDVARAKRRLSTFEKSINDILP